MICINPKTNNLAKTAKPCKTQCIDWSFNTSLLIDTVALLRPLTKNLKSIWRSSKPAKPIKEVRPRHNLAGQHVAFFETLRNHTLFLKHTHTHKHTSQTLIHSSPMSTSNVPRSVYQDASSVGSSSPKGRSSRGSSVRAIEIYPRSTCSCMELGEG